MKKMTFNRWALFTVFGLILPFIFPAEQAKACTGITLKTQNGDTIYGRTMEWGTFDLRSRIVFYPRGYRYKSEMPKGMTGISWIGRHGVAGLDALDRGCMFDGMNEKGLSAGLFYHPGFSTYPEWSKEIAERALGPVDVLTYALSTCENVEEVKKALTYAIVVSIDEEAIGFPAPIHAIFTQADGKQIIVEWIGKKVQFYDSKVGVITNAPEYPWHLTNLRNYVNRMSGNPAAPINLGAFKVSPLGGGSGMLGLPGDFTPPSRFIRAAAFSATVRPLPNAVEGLYELFRILDNFNVPLGAGEGDGNKATQGLHSATAWTIAHDHTNRLFLYHTQNDRQLQMVDLKRIDFGAFNKIIALPIDTGKQSVKDRTPVLAE